MGYDIDIRKFDISQNKAVKSHIVSEFSFSYNWFDFNEICRKHFPEKCPEDKCEKVHLWSFREDAHSRRGDDISAKATKALTILKEFGINVGIPDLKDGSWGYGSRTVYKDGLRTTESLPPVERSQVFTYHVERFRELGEGYSKYFFIGDHDKPTHLHLANGDKIQIVKQLDYDSEDSDSDSATTVPSQSGPVTYFMHPAKGVFKVDNFKSAMEVYEILTVQNDPRAIMWRDLASKMPDAP